jgi:hypothetical protein
MSSDIRADYGEIGRLVQEGFAGVQHHDVEVEVIRARDSRRSFTGLAFWELPPAAKRRGTPGVRYLVRLRLPGTLRNRAYPKTYRYRGRKTAPWITVVDWREQLLALAAHEACHVRQFRGRLRRSEVEAERWAEATLTAWRQRARTPSEPRIAPRPDHASILGAFHQPVLPFEELEPAGRALSSSRLLHEK